MRTTHTQLAAEYDQEARERDAKAAEHAQAGRLDIARLQASLADCCRKLAGSHLRIAQLEKCKP